MIYYRIQVRLVSKMIKTKSSTERRVIRSEELVLLVAKHLYYCHLKYSPGHLVYPAIVIIIQEVTRLTFSERMEVYLRTTPHPPKEKK